MLFAHSKCIVPSDTPTFALPTTLSLHDLRHACATFLALTMSIRGLQWRSSVMLTSLWEQAVQQVAAPVAASQEALLIWHDSVLEKAESDHNPDLCSVHQAKPGA